MKKLLLLLVIFTFISCTETIDKKIVITEYKDNIESIRKNHKEYSDEDYATASNKLNPATFKAFTTGEMKVEKTYRQLLDESKAENLKNKKIEDDFKADTAKLRDVFSLTATEGEYNYLSEAGLDGYRTVIKIKNNSDKEITGLKGNLVLLTEKGEELATLSMDFENRFPAQYEDEGEITSILFQDDKILELKALPFNKLKQEWRPYKIIYIDGETLEAVKK